MKFYFLYTLVFCWIFNYSHGQGAYIPNDVNDLLNEASLRTNYSVLNFKKGHPMMFDKWVKADLISIYDMEVPDVNFQYDLEKNYLLVKLESNGDVLVLENKFFNEIRIKDDRELYSLKRVDPKDNRKFVKILLAIPGFALISREKVIPFKSNIKYHGYKDKNKKYKKKVEYYTISKHKGAERVNIKKSKEVFEPLESEQIALLSSIINSHDIKLKKEEDYMTLHKLYSEKMKVE